MATEAQGLSAENTATSDPRAPPPTLTESSQVQDTPMPPVDAGSLPAPGATAPVPPAQGPRSVTESTVLPPLPHTHNFRATPSRAKKNGGHPPLTLNQLAIVAASQNKLPTSKVRGIVMRMGRHTQSSANKLGRWYKNDNYVDNANYSWRNMELFIDYQKQMYTPAGTIKMSCKK